MTNIILQKNALKEYYSDYCGIDFDYLQFKPQKITDEEIKVLNKFNIGGLTIYDDFIDSLNKNVWNTIDDEDSKDLRSLEFNEFCRVINKYKSIIDEQ